MGHADLATTEIYTAFYPQHADAARISAAFAEQASSDLSSHAA
jgi:site-specific recombinase XerD